MRLKTADREPKTEMADLLIEGGKVMGPRSLVDANLVIEGGKIKEITKESVPADRVIDARGLYVIPGLVDAHVHFRDPGQTEKEDWKTGSSAAAAGGVTTVLDMPNNDPPTTTAKRLDEKREIASSKSIVDFGLYIAADNKNLEELKAAKNPVGVKFFLGKTTGDMTFDIRKLPEYLTELKKLNRLAAFHCEKMELLAKYRKDKFDYLSEVRPPICESMSIRDAIKSMHNNRVHICHVSTEMGLEEIKRARSLSGHVTCEVTPQHLLLTKEDEKKKGAYLKMYPPLRSNVDRASLWDGIKAGLVDMISTDHAPHLKGEKELPFNDAPGGVPGVETRLPLMLKRLDLRMVVELCCRKPADAFALKGKGMLLDGYDADFVLLDLKPEHTISGENLFTKCGWTPFEGMEAKGKVVGTFVRGQQVFDGERVIENKGKEVVLK